ncbi:MAG: citrate/2-methylcitrate synthase [Reyranellaceae bacterium]
MSKRHMTAAEAARALNVSLPTLYAYVSRGLVRSEAPEGSRRRLYAAADVRALQARKARGRKAEAVASGALHFGAPVLESALTLIADNRLYYRGRNVEELAENSTLEAVAQLLWQAPAEPFTATNLPPDDGRLRRAWVGVADMPPIDRCLALLPHAAMLDDRALNADRGSIMECGVRVVRLLAAIVAGMPISDEPAHLLLARGWKLDGSAAEIIRAALVMCADHELNASAFAVRVVAATGATVYGSTLAGLAALQGPRHGGVTPRMVALFEELARNPEPRAPLRRFLQGGERLPGFGHWLYPDGDPRAAFLLRMLQRIRPDDPAVRLAVRTAEAGEAMTDKKPNVDFALATIERALKLPVGGGLALFLLGRAAGWVAHHLEQSATPQLIRPRARYTGPMPSD